MNLERLEDQVRTLIEQNQKVEAIKLMLEATGWGLKESKEYVDSLEDHLAKHLSFTFEAEVSEYQEKGPLQAGDRITAQHISDVDDLYGVIVRLRHGHRQYYLPLCELKVTDQHPPNYQLVGDYAVWFANR